MDFASLIDAASIMPPAKVTAPLPAAFASSYAAIIRRAQVMSSAEGEKTSWPMEI